MRLSRNRNWGHPRLLDFLERFAADARNLDGWPGLLVGDMSQPRGGPMVTGHSSHQIGLDVDIWLTPMPDRTLTTEERENMVAVSMLKDPFTVDPDKWTPLHTKLIKRVAFYPEVDRIFVHPAIKKTLCEATAKDTDRQWLSKVRPMWGHHYHFHIRIVCPAGSTNCEHQPAPASEDGCEHTITLNVWSQAKGRNEVHDIMAAARTALHGQPLTLDGHRLINLRHETSEARRASDGETYHGIARFRAVTEPQ